MSIQNPIREAGKQLRKLRNDLGMTMDDVDNRVRKYAEEHEITVYDFSTGFPQAVQSRIELGKIYRPPNAIEMAKYGVAFNVSPNELFQMFGLPVPGAIVPKANIGDDRLRTPNKTTRRAGALASR